MGNNLFEKLGFSSKNQKSELKIFQKSINKSIDIFKCGDNFTMALFYDGEIWIWGGNLYKKTALKP